MLNRSLKDLVVGNLLPRVQTPGQYTGGELNSVVKDHRSLRGKLCLAFPDAYTIGMSYYGLQVLYAAVNARQDWACERAFAPMTDMEQLLRRHRLPLYSLETFTPLGQFDVLGFSLQYELGCTNVLTMLDLAGVPLQSEMRTTEHPLVIAGGPSAANPEPMSRFIDLFVIGDGEQTLPAVCDAWLSLKESGGDRESMLAAMAVGLPHVYVPRFYRPGNFGQTGNDGQAGDDGQTAAVEPIRPDVPEAIEPAVLADLDAAPLPVAPVVPQVECVQDRIALEIMRGCPGRCRFCQSTTLKRPLRFRRAETLVQAALEAYHNTGHNEISLLSLSTSDYPHFDELIRRLHETFRPLGVSISVPSLRVNQQWRTLGGVLGTERRSGLTLAPEAARDDMRRQIGKRITNDDLYEGCRRAFDNGFNRVKLYFMCGLPGEREADLDGIIEMAETISRLGKQVRGRFANVVASVSNFVPKPQTPYQFNPMQRREYFQAAREHLYRKRGLRSVQLKCHDIDTSLLEGLLCRGNRRTGEAIQRAWQLGARFDAWSDKLQPQLWWQAIAEARIDVDRTLHTPCPTDARLPWDHVHVYQGRAYLEREQAQSTALLCQMCSQPRGLIQK